MNPRYIHRVRDQRSIPIDLKINLENFGPIKKGKVHLKPLTIFIGPNNSGKSYAAMLIHSIISSENQLNNYTDRRFPGLPVRPIRSFDKKIQKLVEKNKGKESFFIPADITKTFFMSLTQDVFSPILESEISKNFASLITDLISTKQKSTKISVLNSHRFDILINRKLNIKTNLNFNIKHKIKISPKEAYYGMKKENDLITITVGKHLPKDLLKYELTSLLTQSTCDQFKHDTIPLNSYYFPAARSGILQGHKALSASIIKSASYGGIESFNIPKLTGVVSDFISNIIMIPRRPGPFFKLAEQLESELLHGHIKLTTPAMGVFPEIIYSSTNGEIPLHRTSSTISEIAPFSLYLKYLVYPSSLLVIEEPEAHLHPTNQLIFAKYLVKMIRAGLNVLITTHSAFLLEQLGEFMLASKIEPRKRKKIGYDADDFLRPDEVSPYVFVPDANLTHTISQIKINDKDGISQEEFVKVSEELYSKSIQLQQNLPEN